MHRTIWRRAPEFIQDFYLEEYDSDEYDLNLGGAVTSTWLLLKFAEESLDAGV
jgi:hypothetical protein